MKTFEVTTHDPNFTRRHTEMVKADFFYVGDGVLVFSVKTDGQWADRPAAYAAGAWLSVKEIKP